jgi:hypothetical protein
MHGCNYDDVNPSDVLWIAHLRNALEMLWREAGRDWLEGVKSDAALDALAYAGLTLKATKPVDEAQRDLAEVRQYLNAVVLEEIDKP